MTKLVTKQYNNSIITFDLSDDGMINLTEIASANNARLDKYMSNKSTHEYIEALKEAFPHKRGNEIIEVKQGGKVQGTWGCKNLALHFAQWINPKFHVWCNIQIEELFTKGKVELPLQKPKTALELAREQVLLLEQIEEKNKIIAEQVAELDYKQDVIFGLVDEVDLIQKRKILNRVVRRGTEGYQERWRALYQHFENIYHCNLSLMAKRKNCSKLDYIDKHLNRLEDLYEICCRLFETDVKQVRQELFGE